MSAEQKKTDRCPLLYEWHKKQYIGAAHGLAGIFYMLMQVRGRMGPLAGCWCCHGVVGEALKGHK